jgi:hypothetical protein
MMATADALPPTAPALSTTRATPRRHATGLRGSPESVPSSPTETGLFGRMFRNLPVFSHSKDALLELAGCMISKPEEEPTPEGEVDPEETTKPIPAGYTYFGQFIDHDLTFDPVSMLDRQNDPNALMNFRTPRFDLDSMFGRGPADQPYLYVHSPGGSPLMLLGDDVSNMSSFRGPDLPRNRPGVALTGDPRNDENLIVSQLHSVFLRFHNAMTARVAARRPALTGDDRFKEVQRQVRWHYQWAVIHDFLPRIVGDDMVNDVLRPEPQPDVGWRTTKPPLSIPRPHPRFYRPRRRAYMPVEFSAAAYRFGHSMVRPIYRINALIPRRPIFTENVDPANTDNLNGLRPLPRDWGFQWQFFFELGGNPADKPMQKAYRIDQQLVSPLGMLPVPNPRSLAARNLLRGLALGLPSGQTVARAMGLPPIPDADLRVGPRDEAGTPITEIAPEFADNAPLWYYILREAELEHEGNQLGPVGGRIVAEVFIGLLAADRLSYLNVEPTWKPDDDLGGAAFKMPNLIRLALSGTG